MGFGMKLCKFVRNEIRIYAKRQEQLRKWREVDAYRQECKRERLSTEAFWRNYWNEKKQNPRGD